MKRKVLLLFFLILTTFNAFSLGEKIYLVTFGPGDDLFLRWGHFGIIIDYQDRSDILFDYGNFSFAQDEFIPNFIKGIMTYYKLKKPADIVLEQYILENRDITLQELNLTPEQVEEYINKLNYETSPGHRTYQYDHYYNNCVSQMANFLDELTDGQFYKGTTKPSGRTFRDYSRDYVASNYAYNMLIMFVLGSKVDHIITEKESLFLPDNTMLHADNVTITDSSGIKTPLIRDKVLLNKSINRAPVIKGAKQPIILNIIIGLFIAGVSVLISRFKKSTTIIQLILGLIMAFCGSVLFFMEFFTGHYYIHNNWNLIFINPLSIALFIGAILKLTKNFKQLGDTIITRYIDITLILIVAMIVLKVPGLVYQANGEIIALFAPVFFINSSFKSLFKNPL